MKRFLIFLTVTIILLMAPAFCLAGTRMWPSPKGFTKDGVRFPSALTSMYEPTGFPNLTDSTVVWSDTTPDRTLTIAPAVSSYTVYVQAVNYVKIAAETIQIGAVEGLHYIYFDETGTLASTTTFIEAINTRFAYVASLYWDATNSIGELYEERHGIQMDGETHDYLHEGFGVQYVSGLALGDFVISTGADNEDAQFSIATGVIIDEDLQFTTNVITKTTGLEVWYLVTTNWRKTTNAGYSFLTGGTGRMMFNDAGGQTEVTDNRYALVHVFAWNAADGDPIAIQGQAQYATLNLARAGAETEIATLQLSGLPGPEMKAIGTVIMHTKDSLTNDENTRVVQTDAGDDYIDFRSNPISGVSPGLDHGNLAGLYPDDDHPQYLKSAGDTMTGNLVVEGSLTADGLAYPTSDGGAGEFLQTDGGGALTFAGGGGLGDFLADGSVPFTGDVDFGGKYATSLQNIPDLVSKGPGYWFRGDSDSVDVPTNTNLDIGTSDATIELLFYKSSAIRGEAFARFEGASDFVIVELEADGNIDARVKETNVVIIEARTSTTPVVANKQTHFAWVIDNGVSNNIYINGDDQALGTDTTTGGNSVISAALKIGDGPNADFHGTVSIVRQWNLALSAAEVEALSSGAPVLYKYIGASQTEMMTTTADRNFSGATDWTNDGFAAYSDDSGSLDVTADAVGDKALITITNLGTDFKQGKRYRLTYSYTETVEGFEFQLDGTATQTLGDAVVGTGKTIEFTADESFNGADELWIVAKTNATAQGSFDNLSIVQIGCVLQLEQTGIGNQQWIDTSGNELHGTVSGALTTNLATNHREKYVDLTLTGDSSFTLPQGYKIVSITVKETAGNALTGGLDVGLSAGGVEVVSGEAIGSGAFVNCVLVVAGVLGATHLTADDIIYFSDGDDNANWNGAELEVRVEMERLYVGN